MKTTITLLAGLITFLSLLPLPAFSQGNDKPEEKTVLLSGCVRNSFTGIGEGGAAVSVYREDGSVVVERCLLITFGNRDRNGNEFRVTVPKGKYRFHVECEGYKPFDYWYEVKKIGRQGMIKLPDFLIQRDFSLTEDNQLGEAVVTTTKIKMYYKGDTLVYNADAFKLPDGSMLDDLIRQLPGAELKTNGDIYINGRKLDFLLLNGKEFFSRNNKVMLENLPYYIVDKLKVYEEKSIRSQALGHQVDANLYVMDVRVKKEYAIGYLGNAEVAGGTHDRYLARLFALRFTDYSRLSLFGGSNNLNESRKPGADSEWKPSDNTAGTERRHNAGFDFLTENKDATWKEVANAMVTWTDTKNEEHTASETFLADGNTFSRGRTTANYDNFDISAHNNFTLKKPFFLDLKTDFSYRKYDRIGNNAFTSFNAHPDSLLTDTLNQTDDAWAANGHKVTAKQAVQFLRNLPIGDDVEVEAYATYSREQGEDFSQYRLRHYQVSDADDARHRYNDNRSRDYEYALKGLYRFNFSKTIKWELSYSYKQSDATAERSRFRLEQINGWEEGQHALDELPSNRALLLEALDNDNSNSTHLQRTTHTLYTRLATWVGKYEMLNVSYYANLQRQQLHYASTPLDTTIRRTEWLHNLGVEYVFRHRNFNRLYYHFNQSSPAMMQLVPVRNTYNPLAITEGNPNLKVLTYHGLYNDFSCRLGKKETLLVDFDNHMGIRYYQNQTATETSYNRETGVYTYRPECVNGNYRLFFVNALGFHLAKLSRLTVNNSLNYDYAHNVDLYLPEGAERSIRSTVHTHIISESLKASYDFGKVQVGLGGKMDYRYATSQLADFQEIRATDWTYGVNLNCQLPADFRLATDFKVYTRRGYDQPEMNTDDLIWNLALTRSVLKGKLVLKLQGFDILHQLSNVTYTLNGQGRTETWRRTIPQYWMLHVQWKFNKHPKRK